MRTACLCSVGCWLSRSGSGWGIWEGFANTSGTAQRAWSGWGLGRFSLPPCLSSLRLVIVFLQVVTGFLQRCASQSRSQSSLDSERGKKLRFFLSLPLSLSFFLHCFLERERERETSMWKRNINCLPPIHTPTGDRTYDLSMCPDQGSNPQPFGPRDDAPTN